MNKILAIIFALFLFASCGNKSKNDAEPEKFEIKRPDVPAMLSSDRERAEYMAIHFWDNFDFADTTALLHENVLGQAFADYVGVLSVVPYDLADKSLKATLDKSTVKPVMFSVFAALFEHYLYNQPHSPLWCQCLSFERQFCPNQCCNPQEKEKNILYIANVKF